MNRIFYISGVLVLLFTACQKPEEETGTLTFLKFYGGVGNEKGYEVQESPDGGYVFIGSTTSYGAGGKDIFLVKTDKRGNQLWYKTFGGIGDEEGRSVKVTPDGGYILLGDSMKLDNSDMFLIKLNSLGDRQWTKTFGNDGSNEVGKVVENTPNGGFILLGNTSSNIVKSDIFFAYTKSDGERFDWLPGTRGNVNTEDIMGNSVVNTADGFFFPYTTTKTSLTPIVAEHKYLGGTENFAHDNVTLANSHTISGDDLRKIDDSNYALIGNTDDKQIYLMKLNVTANSVTNTFFKSYGGSEQESASSVYPLRNGGFAIVGTTNSIGNGGTDIYLLILDKEGNQLHEKTFGGAGDDTGSFVRETSDGGLIISGTVGFGDADKMMCLIKTDAEGNLE